MDRKFLMEQYRCNQIAEVKKKENKQHSLCYLFEMGVKGRINVINAAIRKSKSSEFFKIK